MDRLAGLSGLGGPSALPGLTVDEPLSDSGLLSAEEALLSAKRRGKRKEADPILPFYPEWRADPPTPKASSFSTYEFRGHVFLCFLWWISKRKKGCFYNCFSQSQLELGCEGMKKTQCPSCLY